MGDVTPKTVAVCANYYNESCCDWTADIQVQWCPATGGGSDSFYVYQLVTPEDCDVAYCAGELPYCPLGQFYNPVTMTCQEKGKENETNTLDVINGYIKI